MCGPYLSWTFRGRGGFCRAPAPAGAFFFCFSSRKSILRADAWQRTENSYSHRLVGHSLSIWNPPFLSGTGCGYWSSRRAEYLSYDHGFVRVVSVLVSEVYGSEKSLFTPLDRLQFTSRLLLGIHFTQHVCGTGCHSRILRAVSALATLPRVCLRGQQRTRAARSPVCHVPSSGRLLNRGPGHDRPPLHRHAVNDLGAAYPYPHPIGCPRGVHAHWRHDWII